MTSLSERYRELNPEQKEAVDSMENTVVIAGPGSGKTRIVSIKAAKLCSQDTGVACISFGNATVDRIRIELKRMGFRESGNFYLGTVHSFCLEHIIYSFGALVNEELPRSFGVASENQSINVLSPILEKYNIRKDPEKFIGSDLTAFRRSVVEGRNTGGGNTALNNILREYDEEMLKRGILDFEMIVEWAVYTVRRSELVRRYLHSQFPWILIDEYQDLGGSLHKLVVLLTEEAGISVLAVGDPDQLIFGFSGANEEYFQNLINRGFQAIYTKTCYRFGERMIAASSGALGRALPYKAWEKVNKFGEVNLHPITGISTMQDQTNLVVSEVVLELLEDVELRDPSEIAILYPWKGEIPDSLRNALKQSHVDYLDERDARLPNSPLIEWLRKCAGWSLSKDVASYNEFPLLLKKYHEYLASAGRRPSEDEDYQVENLLQTVLLRHANPEMTSREWVINVCQDLSIEDLLQASGNRSGELVDLETFISSPNAELQVYEVTYSAEQGRIVLTTMHSSKGREFDYVILPGIQLGVIPWVGEHQNNPSFRRLFYVACTRARKALHLVYSEEAIMMAPWGLEVLRRPSPFIADVVEALNDYDQQNGSQS